MTLDLSSSFNVRSYGATGDGQTLDSAAIQSAIEACAAQGGGTVYLPAGQYLTGSLFLRDNISLHLDAGAVILGSENPDDYPIVDSRWEGKYQDTHAPLIGGEDLNNISVRGRGTINGRGAIWWKAKLEGSLAYPRPRLISFSECNNVLIEGITAINSPSWTINPVHCQNVNIRGVTIINPADSPNTDGINPDSCRLVRISDCCISVGDDCITIKSGTEHEHPDRYAPCRDITITNCTLERGHGGVVIGSEMSGGVKNVVISNCVFIGTDRGIRIKSRRGRGGTIEDIRVSNLIMDGVLCPFTMNLYYHIGVRGDTDISDKKPRSVDDGTPCLRHIHFSHITAREVKHAAGFLYGLAEMPLEDVSFTDVSISIADEADSGYPEMADDIPSMSQAGFFIRNARHVRLENVEVTGQHGPAFDIADSTDVKIIPPARLSADGVLLDKMFEGEESMRYHAYLTANNSLNTASTNPCKLLEFGFLKLAAGETYSSESGEREMLAVILGGKASFDIDGMCFENVGGRLNVFSGKPHSVYIPAKSKFTITATSAVEIALPSAPSDLEAEPYVIAPSQVANGVWGAANFKRYYHQILTLPSQPELPARRLIVGETFTPSGNWSTYPPHKHQVDDLPREAYHEEMYFFKVSPGDGFGICHYYNEEGEEENFTIRDNSIHMMPRGYHTVVSAPGYTTYYLWFLAGNQRVQGAVDDPQVGWVNKTVAMLKELGH